jgi:hypothetical protein
MIKALPFLNSPAPIMTMNTQFLTIGLALAASSPFAFSQDQQGEQQDQPEGKPAIALYSAGLEQLLSDPLDQGLLQVLGMLDERIMELAEETGQEVPPKPMVDLALDLLRSPMAFRVGLGDLTQGIGPNVIWGQLDLKTKNADQATELAQRLEGLMGALPFPLQELPDDPSMKYIDLGGMGVQLGSRQAHDQSGTYLVSWGDPRAADMNLVDYGMPAGSRPLFAFGMDLAALQPAIQMGMSMAGEEMEIARPIMELYNVLGADAWGLSMAAGVKDGRMHTALRMTNWLQLAKKTDQYVDQTLSADDYRMIPSDATMASLQIQNLAGTLNQLKMYTTSVEDTDIQAGLEMVEGFLGVNLESDFFSTLGSTFGFYTAESTGGGGLTSMVSFLSIKDPAKLTETMGFLSNKYLGLAQGRARFSKWKHAGVECTTINTPGFPVPMEISMGFSQGYLFMALTRGALAAALEHAQSGSAGLTGLASVQRELPHALEGSMLFNFGDTSKVVREGYGVVSLLYSALANGALSATDTSRELGMIMPTYASVMKRSTPAIMLGWMEGNDIHMHGRASASLTVNLASLAGNPMVSLLVPALVAGGLFGRNTVSEQAYDQSWEEINPQAQAADPAQPADARAQAAAEIQLLVNAMFNYLIDNNGKAPTELEALLKDGSGFSYLWSDELPMDPWGFGYRYDAPSAENGQKWRIYTLGSDALEGGAGSAADLDNHMIKRGEH